MMITKAVEYNFYGFFNTCNRIYFYQKNHTKKAVP